MQLFVLNIIIANVVKKCCEFKFYIACEQALRGTLAAGREQEGELATTSLEFEFCLQFPCGSPLTELSDFRQSERSGNERESKQTLKKHMKARAKGNDVITNVISVNQHSHRLFRCRNSNSRDVVASPPSYSQAKFHTERPIKSSVIR